MTEPKWVTPQIKQKFDYSVEFRNGVRLTILTKKRKQT
jgi:hypothetical protein